MLHTLSPFLFEYNGFGLRYYSLAYLAGVLLTYLWLTSIAGYEKEKMQDFCIYGFFAIVVGGRMGEFLFYHPEWLWTNPLQIFKIWEGGMSFHGGLISVALFTWYFLKKNNWDFLEFTDNLVIPGAFGVALAKLGNFMNGELWGKATDVSWCFVFPHADELCRHPSQLYQSIGNIIVGISLLLTFRLKPKKGVLTALFLIGYGLARITVEVLWREPDWIYLGITSGTWLSIPMIMIGGFLLLTLKEK